MTEKKAIVVGATSGIGLAVVRRLTAEGWQVGIAGRRGALLQEIQRTNLNIIATQEIDITHTDAAERLHTLIGKMGGMDLYFHSSGIGYQNPELDVEKELSTVETNAMGFTRMITAAFLYFESHPEQEGQIAVISSIAGTRGLGASPAYSSTKRFINHYLECLTQLTHIKGLKNITISDIRPGFVRTPLLSDGGRYPMQLDVEEVAKEIVKGVTEKKSIITVDWKYRVLVAFWRMIPRFIWIRLKVVSKNKTKIQRPKSTKL